MKKQPHSGSDAWRTVCHLIADVLEENSVAPNDYDERIYIASTLIDGVIGIYAALNELEAKEKRTFIEGQLGEVFRNSNVSDAQVIAEIFNIIITQLEKG